MKLWWNIILKYFNNEAHWFKRTSTKYMNIKYGTIINYFWVKYFYFEIGTEVNTELVL